MPVVNTKRIEESATTALKSALLRCPIIESYIDSNDKTPSWDGTVIVYISEKNTKDNFAGRVPIQVKGTTDVIVSNSASFSCGVGDLKNYYKDGGCIFFLVSVDLNTGNTKIFYKTLLVVDLDKIIKAAGKQKSKVLALEHFPSEANEIANIFLEFTNNAHKQVGFIGRDLPTLESLEKSGVEIEALSFTVSSMGVSQNDMLKFLSTHDFYLYAKIRGIDMDVPIEKLSHAIVSRLVEGEIRVKEHCFFSSYYVEYEEGKPTIQIENGISIKVSSEEHRFTIHCNLPETLSDVLIQEEFLLEIVEQKELTVNGATISLNGIELSHLQERKKRLEYWKDVKKTLDYLGVNEELCIKNLSVNDNRNLRNITGAVLYNHKIGFPTIKQNQSYLSFIIANLNILIWVNKQADGFFSVDNFFKPHRIALFSQDDAAMKKPIPASHYVILGKSGLLHVSNMDYEAVYQDIVQIKLSPEYYSCVIRFILDILCAYDEQEKQDDQLLDLADRLCVWCAGMNSSANYEVILLNKFQIVKRLRKFEMKEIVEIVRLTDSKQRPSIRCCAYLLLDALDDAQKSFDELSQLEQQEFLQFPICHFGKLITRLNNQIDE